MKTAGKERSSTRGDFCYEPAHGAVCRDTAVFASAKAASVPPLIPAAFVGLGRIASLLEDDPLREKPCTHAGALMATGRCKIVGGMDTAPERRTLFSERWDAPVFSDAREMIRRVRPEILVVATHPDSHERYVTLAASAGVEVVICEKPLAHTLGSARRIVKTEQTGRVRLVINHERRFSRDYHIVREIIKSGSMGALLAVSGTLCFGTARHDRVLLHDGTHMLDAIHFLTQDHIRFTRRVGAMRSRRSSVFLHGVLRRGDTPVQIEIGSERDYLHFEIVLGFSSGRIRIGNGIYCLERSSPSPFYSAYRSLATIPRCLPEPTGYFIGMAREAVRLYENPEAVSRSSAADAYATLRAIRRARTRLR